jgi:hypothetical protein
MGVPYLAREREARPGTGAERMALMWLAALLRPEHDYHPRHRSPRRDAHDDEFGAATSPGWYDDSPAWNEDLNGPSSDNLNGPPEEAGESGPGADAPGGAEDDHSEDFLDQLTIGEIRRILEGCAVNDPTEVVPELVTLIAHSSHTPDTLLRAWAEFEEATRDVFAIQHRMRDWSAFFSRNMPPSGPDADPVTIMRRQADEAWQHITRGQLASAAPAPAGAAAANLH